MKNVLLVVATLCAATFLFTDTAVAGGGKGKSKVVCSNTNGPAGNAMTVWLLTDAQANQLSQPGATLADALRLPSKNIQPGDVETFTRSNRFYTIVVGDTPDVRNPANANVLISAIGIPNQRFNLNRDRTVNVFSTNFVFTN